MTLRDASSLSTSDSASIQGTCWKREKNIKNMLRGMWSISVRNRERIQTSGVLLICTSYDTMNPFWPSLDPLPAYIPFSLLQEEIQELGKQQLPSLYTAIWALALIGFQIVWLIGPDYIKSAHILCIKFSLTEFLCHLLSSESCWVVLSKSQRWGK